MTAQLDSFHHISSAILPSLSRSLDDVRAAEDACRECEALEAGVDGTCCSADELGVEVDCVQQAIKKRLAFIENQVRNFRLALHAVASTFRRLHC